MKNIRFGSFPIVDTDPDERKCIDNYSIKSFADLITMNTQMKSSSDAQQYITPDVILKYFKNNSIKSSSRDNPDFDEKRLTLTRAYKSLQKFSKTIEGNAFYRDKVTYPIYIEHQNKNQSHDYDFILLSNNLVQQEILDEIKYDDALSLTFLFIKDMLYSEIPLSKIGTSLASAKDSYHIRSDIAKFIEFSKSNNTDPISAMLKLIKIAGLKKKRGDPMYTGLKSFVSQNKDINQSISSKFFKLFGGDRQTGQIKDVNFLLNQIQHLDISDFFNDHSIGNHSAPNNQRSHTGYSKYKNSDDIKSETERQYISQKTQEYNKLLSMVDSLINFNSISKFDIIVDVDNNIADAVIKASNPDKNDETYTISINYDKIINSIRNNYFEALLVNMIQRLNTLQVNVAKSAGILYTPKSVDLGASNNAEQQQFLQNEIVSLQQKEKELIVSGSEEEIRSVQNELESKYLTLKNLQNAAIFIDQDTATKEAELADEAKFKSNLVYNIESVQNELTGLLHDIEASLYDSDKLEKIFKAIADPKITQETLFEVFKENNIVLYDIDQLKIAIFDSMKSTLFEVAELRESEDTHKLNYIVDNESEINSKINTIINDQIYLLFKRLGREYANNNTIQSQKYADLRTNKNQIIRKTITDDANFKTYILNEQTLLNLYDVLHHADTQKYIAGLIAYPPSKINNELNIIKYMIKRLGIENNPIFIISKGSVILSQPDFLSLTGVSIFSKVSFSELEQMCRIDYNQMLWNSNQILKKDKATQIKSINDEYQVKIDKHADDYYKFKKLMDAAKHNSQEYHDAKSNMNYAATQHNKYKNKYQKQFETASKYRHGDNGQYINTSNYRPPVDKEGERFNKIYIDDDIKNPNNNQNQGRGRNRNRGRGRNRNRGRNQNQNQGRNRNRGRNQNQNQGRNRNQDNDYNRSYNDYNRSYKK